MMTIKTKLILSAVVEGLLVITLSIILIVFSEQFSQARYNETRATKIVETMSQIRFVSFKQLLHHNERSYEQWQIKHAELIQHLRPTPQTSDEARAAYNTIARLSHEVEAIFVRLIENDQAISLKKDDPAQNALRERLASQLLIKQQNQISQAVGLAAATQEKVTRLNSYSNILTIVVIAVMLIISIVNYMLTARTIAKSLEELTEGARAIAAGKFKYRIMPSNPTDEFGLVAQAFNSMAASTEALDKAKTEFILLASHQLRTPLTAVKWYAEALAKHADALKKTKLRQYATQVYDSNERMITLVNKLLDAARVEADSLQSQPLLISLNKQLDESLQDLKTQISGSKIHIEKIIDSKLPMIFADPTWVHVIFVNLISNAVRYSHPGDTVHITITKKKAEVLISIADNGYGIPASQRDKIFTKLFRADNAKQAIGEGSGLDLYITKAMVERAGGRIWFDSTENKGTTFYVSFPHHTHQQQNTDDEIVAYLHEQKDENK